jgi:hypothetical protein
MCLFGRVLVLGSYVPFWLGVGGRHLCAFLVGVCCFAVMWLSGRGLLVGSYVPFW